MRRRTRSQASFLSVCTILLSLIAVGLACQGMTGKQATGTTNGADDPSVKAVRELIDRQTADWNKENLDGFLEGYWNSPKVVFQSGGERMYGFENVRNRYIKKYREGGKPMGKVAFSKIEIESLGDDTAFARGRWKLDMPDGKKTGGLFTLILRKFSEGWRIIHDHTSAG